MLEVIVDGEDGDHARGGHIAGTFSDLLFVHFSYSVEQG